MSTSPPSRNPFGSSFYIANIMEIFERLAWYGFFTVSSLYMTSPILQGGMGFTDEQRGFLQGLVPFCIYLLPALTGALGDRYGYKKMLLVAFAMMTPCYYLLGQVSSYSAFFLAFMGVAIGAGIFKPLITGTVTHATDDTNRSLGFGVFYMMVNVGGFLGPVIAGIMRDTSWDMVFIMAAVWIAINFIPVTLFYRDPTAEIRKNTPAKPLKDILIEMREVLGNGRFALLVFPILIAFMLPGTKLISESFAYGFIASWLGLNLVWHILAPKAGAHWYSSKIKMGNKPFLLLILILSGFWLVYMQIFITLPLFIRDYVDSSDLVMLANSIHAGFGEAASFVNVPQLTTAITALASQFDYSQANSFHKAYLELTNYNVRIPKDVLQAHLPNLSALSQAEISILATQWATDFRQFKPEYIAAVNFGSIVLLQVLVSALSARFKTFYVIIAGTLMISSSYLLLANSNAGAIVSGALAVAALLIFSLGEMMASPKQQEYVASVMPKDQAAMYQGYLYTSSAIGFLFAGKLSGWGYNKWAVEANEPASFWLLCAGIALITALALWLFNSLAADKLEQAQEKISVAEKLA
ncbi:MFS transporter [Pseudoalteromonas sp.]|uniref:MFS transporter n=1 Tax=Pseudoalteromonas sp. TaxID=53249 RepID=UPI003565E20F